MRGRDVGLSVAVALILVAYVTLAPGGPASPLTKYLVEPALDYWYVGVLLLVAGLVLGRRRARRPLARAIAVVGVLWTAVVIGFYGLLVVVFVLFRPIV